MCRLLPVSLTVLPLFMTVLPLSLTSYTRVGGQGGGDFGGTERLNIIHKMAGNELRISVARVRRSVLK
jgi:hypothetical protein